MTVPRQSLQYKYTSAPQLYSFPCCPYAPYRSLNLTTHICYEALTAKRLRGFFSTLPLNASRQQSIPLGSPKRTLNVSKRHPQGQVGTGVLSVDPLSTSCRSTPIFIIAHSEGLCCWYLIYLETSARYRIKITVIMNATAGGIKSLPRPSTGTIAPRTERTKKGSPYSVQAMKLPISLMRYRCLCLLRCLVSMSAS